MKHHLCLVSVLLSLALLPAVAFATPAEEAKYFYDVIVSGPTDKELSSEVIVVRAAYTTSLFRLGGKSMDASEKQYVFNELLNKGLQGDIHALAMASVLPHVDPEFSAGHDVSPIGPWLIRHLGEAEGHWLLGVFYLHWLSGSPPLSHAPVYMNAPDHFRKSALAGNRKSMLFTSDYAPKGDDFTPPPGQELEHPMADFIAKGDRENWYWKVRAAELGDAWANYFVGNKYAHVQPGWPVEETSRMVLYYWDRAARFGFSDTAAWLTLILDDGENTDSGTKIVTKQDCKKAFFYSALLARMETDGGYLKDKKKSKAGAAAEFHAKKFLKGIPKINFAPCMTQSQYEAALKESKIAYDEFKARQAEEKAAQQALYDKAREALPELRAELAAVGVKIGEGQ
ncbi:hypothetical protein SAMN04488082_1216 [Desulfomicrobium apsheronum]|uniref:TRAP-type C4-dicarboxylate transport system, substrate-binding protein n=1 Tax=Desulfomicrobium apsheronum TaxID=52560 RepID=A0A1I3YSF4_9BACT|nr:hypothetical protein [Desulfomicrobium apsheronum]SFK34772.1 hypothetical protein SAMN04488082_1216 [Desulfomicrobium apsheronum]